MKLNITLLIIITTILTITSIVNASSVGITSELTKLNFQHQGKKLYIQRNQDNENKIMSFFTKTSRKCPPFCIQPQILIPGIETIAELEIIEYIKKMMGGDSSILIIDSRTPDFIKKTGTIPGAINIPWSNIDVDQGATPKIITETLGLFGAKLKKNQDEESANKAISTNKVNELFDYFDAKTLVIFDNGMWCNQASSNIKELVQKYNYPKNKIKWYRGGMQDWSALGFNVYQKN